MSVFIPSKAKAAILALIFVLMLFLDAPEYLLCTHVSPDEIHDFPRICCHEKMVSALIHFERYNRINKILQPYGLPERSKRKGYAEIKRQEGLLFLNHMEDGIYVSDFKQQNVYWKSNTPHNYQMGIDEVTIIESMNQSVLVRFIERSENISSSSHNPLNTVLRV